VEWTGWSPAPPAGPDLERASTAVVLAAGAGTRLRASTGFRRLPKPITPVAGTPLVVRVLRTLREQGVERAIVVTGYAAEAVEAVVSRSDALDGLDVCFVRNASWRRQNGLSVLAARPHTDGVPFVLSMADHVYPGAVVAALRRFPPTSAAVLLAVDRRFERVRDLEDAVRVYSSSDGHIRAIAKNLPLYDAIDTGVFLCRPALFDALDEECAARGGDCSLSDGIRRLAIDGRAVAVDIPDDAWWQDVDTLADLQHVEGRLAAAAEPVCA
jgi:choline kinase